jgi:dipeptidyl aminopeptidase/acylaminoacyl peptidase
MSKLFIKRDKLKLSQTQIKMIKSGWGENSVNNTIVENITYLSGTLQIKGYLAYPKNTMNKYPCIIWCRGGFKNAGAIDNFNAQGIFGQLASWGYVVLETQYRGNAGGEGKDEFGGSDLNDVLNLISLADELPFADTSKFAIEGWSRGGMMVYLTLAKTSIFKAAISISGIANIRCDADENTFMKKFYENSFYESSSGNYESKEFQKKCKERSVINFSEKLSKKTPLLLIHGTADKMVPPDDSLDLSYKLLKTGVPFRLLMLENGDHFLKTHRKEVDRVRKFWFDKYLKKLDPALFK